MGIGSIEIDRSREEDEARIYLRGTLTEESIPEISAACEELASNKMHHVVVDLLEVDDVVLPANDVDSRDARGAEFDDLAQRILDSTHSILMKDCGPDDPLQIAFDLPLKASLEEEATFCGRTDQGNQLLWCKMFKVPADTANLREARDKIALILTRFEFGESDIEDFIVAFDEALANAIFYGSLPKDRGGCGAQDDDRITVTVHAYRDRVDVSVADQGAGYSGAIPEPPDIEKTSGRGILLMNKLVDEVRFTSGKLCGTTVTLSKKR